MEEEDRTAVAIRLLCRLMRIELNQMTVDENKYNEVKSNVENDLNLRMAHNAVTITTNTRS